MVFLLVVGEPDVLFLVIALAEFEQMGNTIPKGLVCSRYAKGHLGEYVLFKIDRTIIYGRIGEKVKGERQRMRV
jgi:hypothetical protein